MSYDTEAAAQTFARYLVEHNIQDVKVLIDMDDLSYTTVDFTFDTDPLSIVFYEDEVAMYEEAEGLVGATTVHTEGDAVVAAMDLLDL